MSELASERNNVGNVGLPQSIDSGLAEPPGTLPGESNFPLQSRSSTTVSPKSSDNKTTSDNDESIFIAGISGSG